MQPSEILKLIDSSKPESDEYRCWKKTTIKELENFELIGEIESSNEINEINTEINYWNENYPISFSYYPYSHCKIYKKENNYYSVYKEFGGHAPELRIRLINKELIQ